jgi:rRNA maturation endonuclease Nob1
MHCGVQLVTHVLRCQRCGAYPDASDKFCIFCGESLKTPELTTA